MITPSFGLTATERVLPKLALDFTTASLDPRITFTRSGATATVVDSAGFIQPVAADTARFDYDPVTLACRGLLIEESRQNIILYSEDLTQTQWIKSGTTISADAAVAPSGATTADKLVENTANSTHQLQQNATFTSGVTYTFSFYAQKAGRSAIRMHENILQGIEYAEFNLDTGVATILAPAVGWTLNAVSMRDAGNGWYRCIVTATPGSTVTNNAFITRARLYNGTSTTYTGDGVSGVYFWGAQLEAGAFATSYIPTTSAALTRNADVATMTGTNFSDWYTAGEGTIQCSFDTLGVASGTVPRIWSLDSGSDANMTALQLSGATAAIYNRGAGVTSVAASVGNFAASNNVAYAFKTNDFVGALNGAAVVTDTSGTLAINMNAFNIGMRRVSNPDTMNGHVQKINYWPMRLTNAEVQAFSK